MNDNIDYKRLLKEYMRHVILSEGIDFLVGIDYGNRLSSKEIATLFMIRNEIADDDDEVVE